MYIYVKAGTVLDELIQLNRERREGLTGRRVRMGKKGFNPQGV
jgi:hypothetical protein